MKVVVVESPAKAKTINKYLGSDYHVLASFGHVRDLPAKDGSVRPDEDFAMTWDAEGRGAKQIREIAAAAAKADMLLLATDPDREGEAISWHLEQELKAKKNLAKLPMARVAFNEITKRAVLEAIANPRQIDQELVDAYLARRALDYLVGFTLSPILWRKMPGSRSAGRVQSVALRIICEREAEIEAFRPQEYWTIEAVFTAPDGQEFTARLTHLDGKKLDKFDLKDQAAAEAAVARVSAGAPFKVSSVERKSVRRNPFPPFITSTLQQEASRKLGFGAAQTMKVAQRLYEGVDLDGETVGLITYMRTDGVTLSQDAINAGRKLISEQYGQKYLPAAPRIYRSAAKNAQEAHEAIRPTDLFRRPEHVRRYLRDDEFRLYDLIWKRTLASQMESAELDQVAIDTASADGRQVLRTTGSIVTFDGFLTLYQEDRDDPVEDDDAGRRLPKLKQGDGVAAKGVKPEQHFTQPPPRYSEASLIKRLEELGIGRPSTYTSILQTLEDRAYVRIDKKRLVPEDRGRLVTAFLTNFFDRYVQYGFTADLETKLDDISGGRARWKDVLAEFWNDFAHLHQSGDTPGGKLPSMQEAVAFLDKGIGTRSVVIDALNEALAPHFFPDLGNGKAPRACPACSGGELGIKLAKNGAFIGCSNYPECRYTKPLAVQTEEEIAAGSAGPAELGQDDQGRAITLRKGPYGFYVQLGEDENGVKPKRVSLPRGMQPNDVTLEIAQKLLSLPRTIGMHPETTKPILAGIGRFGPYLNHDGKFKSIPKDDDVLTIGMNRAVELLAQESKGRGRGQAAPGKEIGKHPETGETVTLHDGKYGHYVKMGAVNATLPKSVEAGAITLPEALALIAERIAKGGGKGRKAAPKSAAKKTAAKKVAAKKTAPKETAPKVAAPKAAKKAAKKAASKAKKKA
ncbi:DNA topoisomerase I [Dongia mobilis]|uniref:DNA topoisomerase 1 n=1 Tax=Dongia mobilis TaxID=578943 RepID=A0A4R6WPI6_9PROT|nr:type I DNA topoisomerase [Dongia mobilis]TDQ81031.1 DNA topoisomerase I [Dongia mobilis]